MTRVMKGRCLNPIRLHFILADFPTFVADPAQLCWITALVAYHPSTLPASLTLWNSFSATINLAVPLLCYPNHPMIKTWFPWNSWQGWCVVSMAESSLSWGLPRKTLPICMGGPPHPVQAQAWSR